MESMDPMVIVMLHCLVHESYMYISYVNIASTHVLGKYGGLWDHGR